MAGSTLRAIGGYRQFSATAPPAIGSELSLCERLSLQVIARAKQPLAEERVELEDSLLAFVEAAWIRHATSQAGLSMPCASICRP